MSSLRVSDNGRYLVHPDGSPFFYLGDTCWELFHRTDTEEADLYLENRARLKFTVIQAVVLAENDGLRTPNSYGDLPLHDMDPARPNQPYFHHVDYIVEKAANLGLFVGMLPTWGDKVGPKYWGVGPKVFDTENARVYGRFLGRRYRDYPIIWIVGGDRPAANEPLRNIWRAMADGLHDGDGGRHLITYHPGGWRSCSHYWPPDEPWLDFHMIQSGHERKNRPSYKLVQADYKLRPTKPTFDGEPRYENHPVAFKKDNPRFDDYDVRQAAYWGLLAGGCGHTYGCHNIWQLWEPGREPVTFAETHWREALDFPGAHQMQHVRALYESRPFLKLLPDQSLIASGQGRGMHHIQAARADDGSFAFVYLPTGRPLTIDLKKLSGERVSAHWYDPRKGAWRKVGDYASSPSRQFTPPSRGRGSDWVLALDAA
jgi:hypothetical protein